jgi:hypothetical protein
MAGTSLRRIVERAMADAAFREHLKRNPERVLEQYDLSEEEHAMLSNPESRRMLGIALEAITAEPGDASDIETRDRTESPTTPGRGAGTDQPPIPAGEPEQAASKGKLPTTDDTTFTVGAPYVPGHAEWPEMAQYTYRGGQHELVIFVRAMTADDVQHLLSDDLEIALHVEGDLLVLLCRIGDGLPWQVACHSWHYVPENRRVVPEPEGLESFSSILRIDLIDATNGIIRGSRTVNLPTDFCRSLRAAIRQQSQREWCGDEEYLRQVNVLKEKFPHPEMLLPFAIARERARPV